MAGHESWVQKRIREKYPSAAYFHCSFYRLNFDIDDLNKIQGIHYTVEREIIKFFRENILRRKLKPHIPIFCETIWSHKYSSIRVFKENFLIIKKNLHELANDNASNKNTRRRMKYSIILLMQWGKNTLNLVWISMFQDWQKSSNIDIMSKVCHPKTTSKFQFPTPTWTP